MALGPFKRFHDLSLQHRITFSVAIGLSALLAAFAYVALWALRESAHAAVQMIIVFGALAIVSGVLLAWLDVRRIVRPLEALTAAAARMGAGELDIPVNVDRGDEIGVLASTLDGMRSRLKELLEERHRCSAELERRVEERTREISALYEELQQKEAIREELLVRLIGAQEEERRRIARELHDESAQALAALSMALDSAEAAMPDLRQTEKDRLDRARRLVSRALGDVRRLIWDLRPTVLDDIGLAPAVRWFAEQHLQNAQIDVQLVGPSLRLPAAIESEVYRIIQEAVTNVARHAQASELKISLGQTNGVYKVVVKDNGVGFEMDKIGRNGQRRGLGLLGMQERARLLSGSLAVESVPCRGTQLTLAIPNSPSGPDLNGGQKE